MQRGGGIGGWDDLVTGIVNTVQSIAAHGPDPPPRLEVFPSDQIRPPTIRLFKTRSFR